MLSTAKPGAGKPSGGSQWVPAQRPWPRTQRYKRKNSENHSLMFSTKTSARGNSTSASKQALVTQLDKVECKERQLHGGQMEAKNMHPNEYIYIYIIIILYSIGPKRIQFKSTCIYVYVSFVPSVISSATAKGLDMADSNSQT